jgi:transcriptional regulator with XRE-family HTH domain
VGLGKKIRALREARKWSQAQLCNLAGVEQATLSAIERRDSTRSVYLVPIARALRVSLDDLQNLSVQELLNVCAPAAPEPARHVAEQPSPLQLYSATGERQSALLRLFDELTPPQQEALLRELETTVQANRAIALHYQGKRMRSAENERIEATFGTPKNRPAI